MSNAVVTRVCGTENFREMERSGRRRRSAAEELRLRQTKQPRPSRSRDECFAKQRDDQQEYRVRAAWSMNLKCADRAGGLADSGHMRAVGDTLDEQPRMNMRGDEQLSQQHQCGDWHRYREPTSD